MHKIHDSIEQFTLFFFQTIFAIIRTNLPNLKFKKKHTIIEKKSLPSFKNEKRKISSNKSTIDRIAIVLNFRDRNFADFVLDSRGGYFTNNFTNCFFVGYRRRSWATVCRRPTIGVSLIQRNSFRDDRGNNVARGLWRGARYRLSISAASM